MYVEVGLDKGKGDVNFYFIDIVYVVIFVFVSATTHNNTKRYHTLYIELFEYISHTICIGTYTNISVGGKIYCKQFYYNKCICGKMGGHYKQHARDGKIFFSVANKLIL